jgi:hypothetical protein
MVAGVVVVLVDDFRPSVLPFEAGGGVLDIADGGDMVLVKD